MTSSNATPVLVAIKFRPMKLIDLAGLYVDVCNKLVGIDNFRSVICFITNNNIIKDTSLGLNIAEEWFNNVHEVSSCDLIVELEEEVLSGSRDCIFQIDEQTANVDSIECGRLAESSLITEEDDSCSRGGRLLGLLLQSRVDLSASYQGL